MAKKAVVGILFLISFLAIFFTFSKVISSPTNIFSFSGSDLLQTIILAGLTLFSSLIFAIFVTLAQDWKIILGVGGVAAFTAFIFFSITSAFIVAVLILMAIILITSLLMNKLNTYITFQPVELLVPSIKQLVSFLIIIFSFLYFLNANIEIKTKGFRIPDSLIDSALKLNPQLSEMTEGQSGLGFNIDKSQLELLKSNPKLLEQYGLDINSLESLNNKAAGGANALIKDTLQKQLDTMIAPYINIVPYILTLLFFVSMQSLTALFSFILPLVIFLIFKLFERSGFITFTKEMREVKKMVA